MDKVIRDPEKFTKLVTILKLNNIKHFECDGMKLTLSDHAQPTTGEPKIDYPAAISDEQRRKEEDEIMFWSSGV